MKRAIYTFKSSKNFDYLSSPLFIELGKLSVDQANKFYETELYCDSISYEYFKSCPLNFYKIHVLPSLDEYKGNTFGVYKMLTCLAQTDSYVHLDFDTILFKPLSIKSKINFGYFDEDFRGKKYVHYPYFIREFYINLFEYKLKNYVDPDDYLRWNWNVFPNCSLLAVNDYNAVIRIYEKVLEMFSPALHFSDYNAKLSQFLEQYMLGEYLEQAEVDFSSIYKKNPVPKITENLLNDIKDLEFVHLQGFMSKEEIINKFITYIRNQNE